MSTSGKIAEALDINAIDIDYDYCEWVASCLYQENPIPHLSLRNTDMAQLKTKCGWENLTFTDNDEGFGKASAHFPESKESGVARVEANIA